MALVIIYTTVSKKSEAQKLARALIAKKLAACVQILGPLESHYVWKGKVTEAPEFLLQIKTLKSKVSDIHSYFAASHPYDLPEFVVIKVASASADYKKWVKQCLKNGKSNH